MVLQSLMELMLQGITKQFQIILLQIINYSYQDNTNPNTGTQGTKSLYYNTTPTENRTLYTGSKGGTYYINSSGNKVYVKNN